MRVLLAAVVLLVLGSVGGAYPRGSRGVIVLRNLSGEARAVVLYDDAGDTARLTLPAYPVTTRVRGLRQNATWVVDAGPGQDAVFWLRRRQVVVVL